MASPRLERRKAQSKCLRCGQQPPIGQAVCFDCADKMAADKRAAVEQGFCIDCWKEPFIPGGQRCAECKERKRLAKHRLYMQRKQDGLCVQCGKAAQWEGRVLCAYCLGKRYGM